ncbi:T9SS type A sorting domain-containing protein [Spirosoma areae]
MRTFLFLGLLVSTQTAQATHLRGGYIQAKPVLGSSLTYQVTVLLYLDEAQGKAAADQANEYVVCFGDGTTATTYRASRVYITDRTVSVNSYTLIHTYAGPGTYALTANLPNRSVTKNITDASNQLFTLATTISTNPVNQTPTPGFPESGFRIGVNQQATISLKATDAEGDSLVYGLAKALTSAGSESCSRRVVSSYQFPNDVTRRGTFKLNNRTGTLVWDSPTQAGYYSIALNIDEYRNGSLISQTAQEILFIADDTPGPSSPIPPYEPAFEGAILTAVTQYADSDVQIIAFPGPVDDRLQVVI